MVEYLETALLHKSNTSLRSLEQSFLDWQMAEAWGLSRAGGPAVACSGTHLVRSQTSLRTETPQPLYSTTLTIVKFFLLVKWNFLLVPITLLVLTLGIAEQSWLHHL